MVRSLTLIDGIAPSIGILTPAAAAAVDSYDPALHTLGVTNGYNFGWRSHWALRYVAFGGWVGGGGAEKFLLTGWSDNSSVTSPEGTNYHPVEFVLEYGDDGRMRLYRGGILLKTSAATFSGPQTLYFAGFADPGQEDLYIPSNLEMDCNGTTTFDANGGTGAPQPLTCATDLVFTIGNQYPTRAGGYEFLGWSLSPDGGALLSEGDELPCANQTLYAQWETPIITFDLDGGVAGPNPNPECINGVSVPGPPMSKASLSWLGSALITRQLPLHLARLQCHPVDSAMGRG